MWSSPSVTQTSSGFVSSLFVPAIDVTSSLTMSDNTQNPSSQGTAPAQQRPLAMVSNAASLPGSVYSFSRVSAQTVSSAWLLPSAPATSVQPLMGSAQQCQHSSMAVLSAVPDQSHMYMPAASYPGLLQWGITESTEAHSSSRGDFPMTVLGQDTAIPSAAISAQYVNTSGVHATIPLYPSLPHSLVQGPHPQIPNQGQSLSLAYQQASQLYYYDQGTLGPVLSGELVPCLPPYGSVSYTGTRASAPQPEMVLVLKQVQPTRVPPSVSTSAADYSGTAEPSTERSFQDMETPSGMQTSLEVKPAGQTFGQPQILELHQSCSSRNSQIHDSSLPPELGDISVTQPEESPANLMALAPTVSQAKIGENLEMKPGLAQPLDVYEIQRDHQDPPWFPLETPDVEELLSCMNSVSSEKPGCEIDISGKSQSLEDQGTLENEIEHSSEWADISTLVGDTHLPQLLNLLPEADQYQSPTTITPEDSRAIEVKEVEGKASTLHCPWDRVKDEKHKASDPIHEAPKAKILAEGPECLAQGRELALSDRAPGITQEASHCKPPEGATENTSQSKGHGQEKGKRSRGNQSRKEQDTQHSGSKHKAEEKPHGPQRKRRRNAPEVIQETCAKPRSSLALHMLESVQVYHALGKKCDKNTGLSSSRTLASSHTKDPQASLPGTSWRDTPRGVKGQERPQMRAQKRQSCAEQVPTPCQDELPPPGKVKLVPLPFLSPERPQGRPVPRKPPSAAWRRPTGAPPAQPAATHSAPPTAGKAAPAAQASTAQLGPATPAAPALTSAPSLGSTTSAQPGGPQSAASRPEPCKAAPCTALQRGPVPTTLNKPRSPPKPQNRYLLEDFAAQPIPWRKPNVPEPVMSSPISREQRPEREAMKRQAQLEREEAAMYTSWGRLQFFVEREREMEISLYYGYVG